MNKIVIPKHFQGVLWSSNIKGLDLEKDKVYIIHQILAHGGLEHYRWLFTTYKKKEIIHIFTNHPLKIYSDAIFEFVSKFILGTNIVNKGRYVASS